MSSPTAAQTISAKNHAKRIQAMDPFQTELTFTLAQTARILSPFFNR